jgi:hypothetical protein
MSDNAWHFNSASDKQGSGSFTVSSSDRLVPPNPLGARDHDSTPHAMGSALPAGGGGGLLPAPLAGGLLRPSLAANQNMLRYELFDHIAKGSLLDLRAFLAKFRANYPGVSIDDLRDINGGTGLHAAVASNNEEIVSELLKANALPHNGRWSDNNTPLHEAASRNNAAILALFLQKWPEHIYDVNKKQQNVLQVAIERKSDRCVPLIEAQMKQTPPPIGKAGPRQPGGGGLAQATEMGHFTPSSLGLAPSGGLPAAPPPPTGNFNNNNNNNNSGNVAGSKGVLRGTLLPAAPGGSSPLSSGVSHPMMMSQQPPRTGASLGTPPNMMMSQQQQQQQQQQQGRFPSAAPAQMMYGTAMAPRVLERLTCEGIRHFSTASLDSVQGRMTVQRMLAESSPHFTASWRLAPPLLAPRGDGTYMRLVIHALRITEVISPDRFISRGDALKQLQHFLNGLDEIMHGSSSSGYYRLPSPAQFDNPDYVYKGALAQGFTVSIPKSVWNTMSSYVHCEVYHRVLRNALIDLEYDKNRATEDARAALLERAHSEAAKRLSKPESFGYVAESALDSLRNQFPNLLTNATTEEEEEEGVLESTVRLSVFGGMNNLGDLELFFDRLSEVTWACSSINAPSRLPRKMPPLAPFSVPPENQPAAPYLADHPPPFRRLAQCLLPLAVRSSSNLIRGQPSSHPTSIVASGAERQNSSQLGQQQHMVAAPAGALSSSSALSSHVDSAVMSFKHDSAMTSSSSSSSALLFGQSNFFAVSQPSPSTGGSKHFAPYQGGGGGGGGGGEQQQGRAPHHGGSPTSAGLVDFGAFATQQRPPILDDDRPDDALMSQLRSIINLTQE